MKKFYSCCFSILALASFILPGLAKAQTTVSSPSISNFTYNSATAAGAIVFGVKNNNSSDVIITEVANYMPATFTGTFTLWYHPTAVTGAPPAINTTNGWVELMSNSVTSTTAGITTLFTGVNLVLPVNTTYRLAISGPPLAPYYGGVGTTPNVYAAGGVDIYVQDNPNSPGYGGAFPGPPGNTPRSFLGSITFVPASPCTDPPAAGQAIASKSFVCLGASVVLDLTANTIGTGQTYQWQSSPSVGGPYTNVGSASNSPVLLTSPAAPAWYKALVSCSGGTPQESLPVFVDIASPLSGTFTIDNTMPTAGNNFQSFTDAVNRLNLCGVAGPVVFNAAAGQVFTEDVPVITASGTSTNTITFQKSGVGDNPKIIPLSPGTINTTAIQNNGDGIIVINGGDYFTFDAIDLETNPGFTGAGMYEYGYYTKKATATNACKNITIKNSVITLNKAQPFSYGIYISNISGTASVTVTSTGGRSENIKISGNTITAFAGIQVRGYAASTPYDLYDQNIEIGVDSGNVVTDFGGGSQAVFCYMVLNASGIKIANNTLTGGTGTTGTVYGMYTSATGPSDVDFYNNTISYTPSSTSGSVYGIYSSAGAPGSTINIYDNTVSNVNIASGTSGLFYAIYQLADASSINIYGNTVSDITKTGTGTIYGIYNGSTAASGTVKIHDNIVKNISLAATVYGIYSNPVATSNIQINNNEISNLSGVAVSGITLTGGAGTKVYQNKIYDIGSTGTTTSSIAYGIYASSGTAGNTYDIYNNIIGNITAPASTATDGVRGISTSATTATTTWNVSYNTIYLNASSSGTNFGSAGIYHATSTTATSGTLELRNNLIFNVSTANGTGKTAAFRRSSGAANTLNNYGSLSNNNLFYAGSPSPTNVIYWDGTTAHETMAAYKAHVGPRDNVSISEMVTIVNTTTGADADFLRVDPTIPTQVESGGIAIAGIDDDFDGQPRQGSAGYTGTGNAPDIGADEFEGIAADFTRPLITHTPLKFTCSAGDRTLSVEISDGGGLPTTGALVPRVYYRKGAGAWYSQPGTLSSGDGNTGTWQFSILAADMGGLIIGDVVEYYVIAQDNAGNIASNPAGVTATNVNTVTVPPAPGHTYRVSYTLNGTYTINSGSPTDGNNFQTFTDAVNVCVTGPVVFNVQPGSYNEQVLIEPIAGASATNTITFNGNGETLTWLSTNTNERAVIKFNGADHIKFDNLNITALGTQTTEYGYAVQLVDDADNNTISNCIINVTTAPQTASSTSFAGIVVNSSSSTTPILNGDSRCDNNTFSGNTITGGYYGIVLSADGGSNLLINGNRVTNNTIQDFYSYGIYLNGTDNTLVEGNDVSRPSRSGIGVFNGIYATEKSTNLKISKNKIHNSHSGNQTETTAAYGVYLNACDATPGNENIVSNNMIYQFDNSGLQYGLYNTGSDLAKYYYNSVLLDKQTPNASTTLATRAFYQTTVATGLELKNNIFSITRNTPGVVEVIAFNTATTTYTTDYNILHLGTGTGATNLIAATTAGDYATLIDWQATGNDQHSHSVDPLFTAPNDLHLQVGSPADDKGIALAAVTTDIDGETRGASRTDVGADELPLAPGIDMQAVALISPAFSASNCYSVETITVAIKNNSVNTIDFSISPVTVNVNVSGAGAGAYTATVNTGTLASGAEMNVTMTSPSATIDMSGAGVYFFDATVVLGGDINPANNAMTQVSLTKEALSAGTIAASPENYCITPGAPTLTATGMTGYSSLQWQQSTTSGTGFTDIPGATTNPYTLASAISQNMYYRLKATCGTNEVFSDEDTVTINNPQFVSTTPGSICGPGSVTLAATGTGDIKWYTAATGGSAIANGSTFMTPVITTTTTYYASITAGGIGNASVGAPVTASTSGYTLLAGLDFDAFIPFTLTGVYVYPLGTGAGDVVIALQDASQVNLQTITVNLTGASAPVKTFVPLNFNVPAGTGLSLVMLSRSGGVASLVRDLSATTVGSFPFTLPGVVSITQGRLGAGGNAGVYYFFYDWQVSVGCESQRVAVTATVKTTPDNTTVLAGTNNGVQHCATYDVSATNYYFTNCELIARVSPQGGSAVSGEITSCVRIDPTVQTYGSQPYVQRHYDITPANNAATATARVTLFATQAEFDAYNSYVVTNSLNYPLLPASPSDPNAANVRVTQFHGTGTAPGNYTGNGQLLVPVSATWNSTNNWWEISVDVTGFSGFYLHTTYGGPLPVTLLTFSGQHKQNRNELRWTTASENNSKGFELERSADGRNFSSIGFIATRAAGGNSSSPLSYSFTDASLMADKYYYRLKQLDNDNRYNYSKIIILKRSDVERPTPMVTTLYPNPVVAGNVNLAVYSPENGSLLFRISDATGKVIREYRKQVSIGSNTLFIPVDGLANGTYFVQVQGSTEKALGFVKQ